jgi:hypothetical protein
LLPRNTSHRDEAVGAFLAVRLLECEVRAAEIQSQRVHCYSGVACTCCHSSQKPDSLLV